MTEIKEEEIVMLVRSMYYYESVKDDSEVEVKLRWYAERAFLCILSASGLKGNTGTIKG